MKRNKLSIREQINKMEKSGIQFNIMTKNDATIFLCHNTYYFKIKSYSKNYDKRKTSDGTLEYINLDFAYLKELSTIDMYLRKFIIRICLDIEHFLKVQMLDDLGKNSMEDGYNIVNLYFARNTGIKESLDRKSQTSYCKNLVAKFGEDYALWNLVEVLSFGEFSELYRLYFTEYRRSFALVDEIYPVRKLRNAAAHNNCLINSLKIPYDTDMEISYFVNGVVSEIPGISKKVRDKKLSNPVMHDFVAMLYVFSKVVSPPVKTFMMKELKEFCDVRMTYHKDYFEDKNGLISSYYDFFKKIIDYFYNQCV